MPALPQDWSVTISPQGWTFDASAGQSLLEAAASADYMLPSSCRNGTCRTCMCRLVSGVIRYRIDWPGLSVDEKRAGFILPCVAFAESALVIHSPASKLKTR
ncbi:MAG: 2Fe-2S iron-sulfur cluster binding domain-containing protein [Herminiimonas sp.]|nr:2Fe-2S iron-sulfur cluster binding domain-containing protein [Herminiimonas sp.]